jgi:hypothetical protein
VTRNWNGKTVERWSWKSFHPSICMNRSRTALFLSSLPPSCEWEKHVTDRMGGGGGRTLMSSLVMRDIF